MKLCVLSCGQMYVERAFILHFGTKEDSGKEYVPRSLCLPSIQYYIDHSGMKILFDAGLRIEELSQPREKEQKIRGFPQRRTPEGMGVSQKPDENPVAQLKKIGISIDDIDYVVISHLMNEHAGWLPAFAGKKAQVIVQQKEYDYAFRIGTPAPPGQPPAIEQFHSWMYKRQYYDVPGLNFKLIEGDYRLDKDMVILSAPGHTPGYQMMLVRLPETGTVVLSGCEHRGMYYSVPINGSAPGIPHAFTWFAAEELRTFKIIKELVEREKGQIFCGHDWEQYLTQKHCPEYYE